MSQAKVDKYKENKPKRKKDAKKERRKRTLYKAAGVIVCLAIVGWIGYSGVHHYINTRPTEEVEVKYDAIDNYVNNMGTTDENTESAE